MLPRRSLLLKIVRAKISMVKTMKATHLTMILTMMKSKAKRRVLISKLTKNGGKHILKRMMIWEMTRKKENSLTKKVRKI